MEKKIMLAVDDSVQSKQVVEYAVRMSSSVNKLHYVLFNVQPAISQFLLEEAKKSRKNRAKVDKIIKKNTDNAHQVLEIYKNEMVRMGISEDRVETVTKPRKQGLAKDIIDPEFL